MGGGISIAFALSVAASFFRKFFSTKTRSNYSQAEIATLGQTYAKWELIALPFVLGYAALTGYAWFLLFSALGRLAASIHERSLYVLVPGPVFWALPAIFLGIVSAAIPTHFTLKALLGVRCDEYTLWTDLNHGFDGWKAFRIMSGFIL